MTLMLKKADERHICEWKKKRDVSTFDDVLSRRRFSLNV